MSFPAFDLTNRVAVVIGATSGIGKAIALGLADAGAAVVPTGRRSNLVHDAVREVEVRGRSSLAICSDVTDTQSIITLANAVIERFGKVDILVNAAGITVRRPTVEVSDSEWNEIMNTNLTGMLRACRAFGPHMIAKGYGRIINIGSLTSLVALQEVTAYGASKAGVAALTRSLAVEWAPYGVSVNAILPGSGYSIARTATCTFTIKDGVFHTNDFEAQGKLFSMLGHGDVHFVDDKLDFSIRMDMHGAAGVLLTPMYKLFEYEGTGSAKHPDWHPKRF